MDISDEVCKDCIVFPMCKDFCDIFRTWANKWIEDAKSDIHSQRMLYLKSVDPKAYEALAEFVGKKQGVCITHPRTNKLIIFDGEGEIMGEHIRFKV